MRKFIFIIAAALTLVFANACTSCNNNTNFGIEYSLQSDGLASSMIEIAFNGGSFTMNGDANYALSWNNTVFLKNAEATPLESALESKNIKTVEAAKRVNDWLNDSFKLVSAEGMYDIYVKGYIKEIITGIIFKVDKRFTNIPVDDTIDYE